MLAVSELPAAVGGEEEEEEEEEEAAAAAAVRIRVKSSVVPDLLPAAKDPLSI